MDKKQIEPTDAMVDEAANALALEVKGTTLHLQSDAAKHAYRCRARVALRVVLNHPDAPGLFADVDDRPWEPLNGRPVRVGYEVRQERAGITITGVVARVDKDGDPRAADDVLIGLLHHGTWYVRRPVQELPTEKGAVIVRKGERIEARHAGKTWVATEAVLVDGEWRGTWFEKGRATGCWNVMWAMSPDRITPGTWKVEGE